MKQQFFAEVIESSMHSWLAQSWQWNHFPHFGSLVMLEQHGRIIFGIVHQIKTGSMDPMRYPFAYQKTEEELLKEQPQIFEFLKTTFSCLIIGYKETGTIFYQLAPEPPKIHTFVAVADKTICKEFFASHNYLHPLFALQNQIFNMDELLLALLRSIHTLNFLNQNNLEAFIEQFSLLTGNDYRRLKLFLQRVEPLMKRATQ